VIYRLSQREGVVTATQGSRITVKFSDGNSMQDRVDAFAQAPISKGCKVSYKSKYF
jgi:hypothetical protein